MEVTGRQPNRAALQPQRGGLLQDVNVNQVDADPHHLVLDLLDSGAQAVLVGLIALLILDKWVTKISHFQSFGMITYIDPSES